MLNNAYPQPPLSPIPQVLLDAFLAERAIEDAPDFDGHKLDEVECQRAYALYAGARDRAASAGGHRSHDTQAAALLVGIDELDVFLDGGLTIGGEEALRKKLGEEELGAIRKARNIMAGLLEWHFIEGAGALLPVADFMGLVVNREDPA